MANPKKLPKSKSAKRAQAAKAKAAIPTLPDWQKTTDFVYESVDPITGGIWRFLASKETQEDRLNQTVRVALVLSAKERPPKGQVYTMVPMVEP